MTDPRARLESALSDRYRMGSFGMIRAAATARGDLVMVDHWFDEPKSKRGKK